MYRIKGRGSVLKSWHVFGTAEREKQTGDWLTDMYTVNKRGSDSGDNLRPIKAQNYQVL